MDIPRQKEWIFLDSIPLSQLQPLIDHFALPKIIAALLVQRGIKTPAEAERFFTPSLLGLHPPETMKGMALAVKRIGQALDNGEKIMVYGDYDVDGITSTLLLDRGLKRCGGKVIHYIPDRHTEGYGVSMRGIAKAIEEGITLLITVDCGIRAIVPVEKADAASIDVIICDHHQPGETLPAACAILDPQQSDCTYPFKGLSGCGVAFKLLQGMADAGWLFHRELTTYLDLVALSIAADIVPIVDENRILMHHGIAEIERNKRPGMVALRAQTKRSNPLTVTDLVFGFAPPINAAGRLAHANAALNLLKSPNAEEADRLSKVLLAHNEERKRMDQETLATALDLCAQAEEQRATTVLFQKDWHKGILGIVASRCIEQEYRPTILLTQQGEEATGSARSIPGYNLYEALVACEDLLTRYGGHAHAAGLTLPLANLPEFQRRFEKVVKATLTPECLTPYQKIDSLLDLRDLTPAWYNALQSMRPFGPGHRQPVFCSGPLEVVVARLHKSHHLSIKMRYPGTKRLWSAIGFNFSTFFPWIMEQKQGIHIAYTLQKNPPNYGGDYVLHLKDIHPA